MNVRALALPLALALLMNATPRVLGQSARSDGSAPPAQMSDWIRVRSVAPGTRLLVITKAGKTVKGKLDSVSDAELSLSRGGRRITLDQKDIRRVYQARGWPRTKTTLIGASAGGGTGVAVGAGHPLYDRSHGMAAGLVIGAIFGTALGAVVGGERKGRLLYQAP